jgi:hypothetical protein
MIPKCFQHQYLIRDMHAGRKSRLELQTVGGCATVSRPIPKPIDPF